MRLNLYSQNRHVVVINGVPLSGFADGDYMEFEKEGNEAARTHGGDGPSMSVSTDQGGKITVGLMPTSPSLGMLYSLREAQQANPAYFNVQLITGVEEVVMASGCMFGKLPAAQTGGPTQRARQFAIECLDLKMDLSDTQALAGGLLSAAASLF